MTIEQRIHMYKGKKLFIDSISKVFEIEYLKSNVSKIEYEVYFKAAEDNTSYYTEFVVVTFVGGGKSVRVINGNSNNTNFQEIGKLINGGYYDDIPFYEDVRNSSTLVNI